MRRRLATILRGALGVVMLTATVLATQPRYSLEGAGDGLFVVHDDSTALEWEQGKTAEQRSWSDALAHCQLLDLAGHADWRLPTVNQLSSIVDDKRADPAVNSTFFSHVTTHRYWTSTTYSKSVGTAFVVDFHKGGVGFHDKGNAAKVLCVRSQ